MYGNGPCQSDRILGKCTQLFFFNLFLFLVVTVADVTPAFSSHIKFLALFCNDIENTVVRNAGYCSDCSVDPSLFLVVFDEDNLCTRLYFQFHQSRKTVFGKLSMNFSFQNCRFTRKSGKFLFVDIVYRVASCSQSDVQVVFLLFQRHIIARVQKLQVGSSGYIGTDVVEYVDKYFVRLPVYFCQFDRHQFHFLEDTSRKEVRIRVEAVDDFPFIIFYDRLQLIYIAYQQKLFPSKRFAHVLRIHP